MKETFYFTHDYSARSDEKIKRLLRKHGYCGYGIFWAIVEDLYNNANAMQTDYEGIAFDLHSDSETIKSIINDFDLFEANDGFFGSLSVQRRLDERSDKSGKARVSALKRWDKNRVDAIALNLDANAMLPEVNRNAKKESKGEEKKEKKIIDEGVFFLTKSNRKLSGKRLDTFNVFWNKFDYKKGKAEAADSWFDIPLLTDILCNKIYFAAETEAKNRVAIIASGKTPKMAQGWLTAKRWEDEALQPIVRVKKIYDPIKP